MLRAMLVTVTIALITGALIAGRRAPNPTMEPTPGPPVAHSAALAAIAGLTPSDDQLVTAQSRVRSRPTPAHWERLAWAFVDKAKRSHDPGFYKLAQTCADALDGLDADSDASRLLRAHVAHNLHQFREAETLARVLVERRGLSFDHGVLGDALLEQGRLDEAATAYQAMVDLKPDVHSYSRIGHLRSQLGDLEGAIDAMIRAAKAATPRQPYAYGWAWSQLGRYHLRQGDLEGAARAAQAASVVAGECTEALRLEARVALAQHQPERALAALQRAATLEPLPSNLWPLADVQRALGQTTKAADTEERLRATGGDTDPRGLSLFLATRRTSSDVAERLAEGELRQRQDAHTWDTVAWSARSSGRMDDATRAIGRAVSSPSPSPRIAIHAAVILDEAGQPSRAGPFARVADQGRWDLWPSERALLDELSPSVLDASHPLE